MLEEGRVEREGLEEARDKADARLKKITRENEHLSNQVRVGGGGEKSSDRQGPMGWGLGSGV